MAGRFLVLPGGKAFIVVGTAFIVGALFVTAGLRGGRTPFPLTGGLFVGGAVLLPELAPAGSCSTNMVVVRYMKIVAV